MPLDEERLGYIATRKSTYDHWRDSHGIPVITGFYLPQLSEVELAPWDWRGGGSGAFLDLEGTAETSDSYLLELKPGEKTAPLRHIYEEMIYVVEGSGVTKVWQEGKEPVQFEWHKESLFAIPLNAYHQHFNPGGSAPARFIAVTSAPLVINLYHNLDFVFDCPFTFNDRFDGESTYFDGDGRALERRIWDTNFVANVLKLPLEGWEARGKGSANRGLELCESSMAAHVSEIAPGRYKKAHRHGPGAHVIMIEGDGYSLMWPEGSEIQRFDWRPGTLIVPPDQWFHQHFNVSPTPAKYLALRWNSHKYRVFPKPGVDVDVAKGGSQIETANEDPTIRAMFEKELHARGVPIAIA